MTQLAADSSTTRVTAHVINHTHWDREWFLTHEYTTEWIPALIDNLDRLATENPDYRYLFDGQTLVIEDLLQHSPTYRPIVERLVRNGQLQIGPIYSQPDWRLVCGELHLRNLRLGAADTAALGGTADTAWLVDTFGHLSQTPQMLALAGIDGAFVWRGVPAMYPVFDWSAPDGSTVSTVDLFGGYRNLYGIEKTESIAVDRLVAETAKLQPHYGSTPIPLFDGYDLDSDPEDPARFYAGRGAPATVDVVASSPRRYLDAVADVERPRIEGELLSGKFGATFPGSLSTRTSLKVMHHDVEQALFARAQPLGVLASNLGRRYRDDVYETVARELLRNAVHDCICGVSIDPVHERMERSYGRLLDELTADIDESLATVLGRHAPGTYAVSSVPAAFETTQRVGDRAIVASTDGIGVEPITASHLVERFDTEASDFSWTNDHYRASVTDEGVTLDGHLLARFVVTADHGDTYSSEPGDVFGVCRPTTAHVIESRSAVDTVVAVDMAVDAVDATGATVSVTARVRYRFDAGPVVYVDVDLDSTGTGFRIDAEFQTGVESNCVHAAMPFDLVERPHSDTDLLPHALTSDLAAVLMGQREVASVDDFPFHDFVALRSAERVTMALGQGTRSYRSDGRGTISIALRRSVEWLARTGLTLRDGDAGPAMYVPGAREERTIRHRLGIAVLPGTADDIDLWRVSASFQTPPLIAEVVADSTDGAARPPPTGEPWSIGLPCVTVELVDGRVAMRVFNPSNRPVALPGRFEQLSVDGDQLGQIDRVDPGCIVTIGLPLDTVTAGVGTATVAAVHGLPMRRVGRNRSRPHPARLDELDARRQVLAREIGDAIAVEQRAVGVAEFRATHHRYVLQRELAEIELSLELNRRRAASDDEVSLPDERDPVIERLGADLNDLRIRRRIYDYVVQSL